MPILHIVATPIGNLHDITFRALEILKEADLILCEDTRVTKKLLDRYEIKTPTLSYHQHSKLQKINYILELLERGKNLAVVSDAGTPGISDPGNQLVSAIFTRLNLVKSVKVVPIPGPSALTCAVSISGFPMDRFLFLGFPPTKRKRKKFFGEVINSKYPVIFYESPYRILKTLNELKEIVSKIPRSRKFGQNFKLVVGRELTKKFESIYRGKIEEVIEKIEKDKIKGEFVVIVGK